MSKYVVHAGRSYSSKWLYEAFEYGRFPLAGYIAWAFEKGSTYKFWVNGKLVARKAVRF